MTKLDDKEKETNNNEEVESNLEATKEELENQSQENSSEGSDPTSEIDQLKKELEESNNKYLRLTAEFQNFKRRTEKEKNDIYQFGSEKVIVDMISIFDNLERAITASNNEENESGSLKDGLQMIYKQFEDVLLKHGVEEIECLEKEFDPNYHHAVFQEEITNKDSNIILEVYEKGYTLNSKVIRPSMVKVSK